MINRVQNLRKDSGLDVTDKINLKIECSAEIQAAISENQAYVATEVLAADIQFVALNSEGLTVDLVEEGDSKIFLEKA